MAVNKYSSLYSENPLSCPHSQGGKLQTFLIYTETPQSVISLAIAALLYGPTVLPANHGVYIINTTDVYERKEDYF